MLNIFMLGPSSFWLDKGSAVQYNNDTIPAHCHPQLHTGGIIIMKDTSEEEEELVEPVSAHGPKIEEEEQEPEAPEPFEYIDE